MSSFSIPSLASMKSAVDELRAQVIPKNETEKRVYEALSSKNWGASTTMLNEIASDSYDYDKYGVIMKVVWDIINSQGSSWKQVFKAVSLLEFLVKNGAERTIEECRDNMRTLRRLQDYNYFEGSADKGSGTREKAKQLVELLGSNDYIREEREKAQRLRNKFTGVGSDDVRGSNRRSSYGGGGSYGGYGGDSDRYGGRGSDDNRYGGSDRYGGRNDSYGGDNNFSSYDESGGYGGGGIPTTHYGDRSSGGSGGRRSTYDDSRDNQPRGGGSYSSGRSGGYSDEPRSISQSSQASKLANTPVTDGSGSGKLKIKIKNANSPAKKTAAPKQEEADFFNTSNGGNDFFQDSTTSTTTPATTSAFSDFDAFGDSTTSNDFAAFQSAPASQPVVPQPVVQPTFDVFQSAPAQQQQQQQFEFFQSAPVQHQQQPPIQQQGQFDMFQSAPIQQMQPVQQKVDNDFGEFESATTTAQTSNPAPVALTSNIAQEKKTGSHGGLVNLDNLSLGPAKSTTETKSQSVSGSSYSATAFAGLDGFSKSSQPTNMSASSQMGSGMRPMGAPMNMGQQSMGMMGGQQMGGQQMGGQMGMFGGQMGMMPGQQMGGQVGMGGQQPMMGGQMGMMGQPMGNQMNMGGRQSMSGQMGMMGGQPQMGGMNMGMMSGQQQNQFGGNFNF